MKFLYLILLIIFPILSSAQTQDTLPFSGKVYYNWYFGIYAGVTFDTPDKEPKFIPNSPGAGQNGSTISTKEGDYLLHTMGDQLWNRNFDIIHKDMGGHNSQSEGSVIAPLNNGKYIFFTTVFTNNVHVADEFDPPRNLDDTTGLVYSIFSYDYSADTIIFDVYKKQINESYWSEGIQLGYSAITNKYILIGVDIKGEISAYEFDLDGNYLRSKKQSFYEIYSNTNSLTIRINQICDKISISYTELIGTRKNDKVCVVNFDSKKLKFYKYRTYNFDEYLISSIEFSSNSKYLYVYLLDPELDQDSYEYLERINLLNETVENIYSNPFPKSRDYRAVNDTYIAAASPMELRIAPNKKIYLARAYANHLSSIESPNDDNYPNYRHDPVYFEVFSNDEHDDIQPYASFHLPQYLVAANADVYVKSEIIVCEGEDIELFAKTQLPDTTATYSWSGPNNYESTEQNPTIENANQSHAGLYTVTVETDTDTYSAETFVRVKPSPVPAIRAYPKAFLCEKGEVTLSLIDEHESYLWSTGDTTEYIVVEESGTFGVTVENELGCTGYAEIQVVFGDEYELAITGDTIKCEGESVTLTSEEEYPSYRWSNGADTRSITVVDPANYTLTVTTEDGCEIKRTIEVKDHPNVIAELKPAPTTICEGDSVILESKYDAPYFDYLWSTNETTKSIYASKTETYKLTITDTRTGCMDSTEIAISVEDNLQPTIIGSDICEGQTATLEALPNDPSYSYEWSNGETTPTIVVSQPAMYTVTVSKDGCSGTAEFTVNESPNPEFEILGEDIICGNSAILSCSEDYAEYLWSTDEVTKEIEVTEPGTYSLTVTDENGCSATEEFTVKEQSLSFDISKDRIDFGKIYISETATDAATIINTSGFDIELADGQIVGDGTAISFNKTLDPTELGTYTDSFEYRVISPCDTVITIPVTAEVYARVEISTEDVFTEIGAEESIPVYLECEADLSQQTYSITTDIDQSILYTEDDYTITQTAEINEAKTQIHEINGTIMLANELEYDIKFPSYEFNNPYIEVIDIPGKIYIDSICVFPLRTVTFLETTEMKVSPNPAKDKLVVDVTTDVSTTLNVPEMKIELISSEGRVAYTENWTQTASEKQLNINTDKIPSGLYQVRLQTPSGVLTQNVIVVR